VTPLSLLLVLILAFFFKNLCGCKGTKKNPNTQVFGQKTTKRLHFSVFRQIVVTCSSAAM
jgi:hypothetical protein